MAAIDPPYTAGGQPHQLPLGIRLRDDATMENYVALDHVEPLLLALNSQLSADGEAIVYLYGPAGTGKSHLLQASCQHGAGVGHLYLPLTELADYAAGDVLQGVSSLDRVCIDDVHAVLGNDDWERELFNLINDARQSGCRLVIAGNTAPRVMAVNLEDLRSRLSGGVVFQLEEARDEDKAAILRFRASRRGITLSDGVANYIVSRAPRGMEHLLAVLEELDKESLAKQRTLSIPFVKAAMGW